MTILTYPSTFVCDGCKATLVLTGSPGMDMDDAITANGWNGSEDGYLCSKCCKGSKAGEVEATANHYR